MVEERRLPDGAIVTAMPRVGRVETRRSPWIVSFLIAVGLPWIFVASAGAAGPDKPVEPLNHKEVTAEVYVTRYAVEGGNLTAVELLWVPPSAARACLGKSPDACRKIVDNRGYRPGFLGAMSVMLQRKFFFRPPRRVLTQWVKRADQPSTYEEAPVDVVDKLKRMPELQTRIPKGDGEHAVEHLTPNFAVRCRLEWTLWPNGESFSVLDVVK